MKASLFLSSLATTALVTATTRQFNLEVARMQAAPDGYMRSVIGINGQYPGPPIVVDKGDTLMIQVTNRLSQPTSLHCHGFEQRSTPFYDGVSGITQCPIQPNDYLTYTIPTGDQPAGTTWYHAHYKAEYADGFHGPLIVRDPNDPHRNLYDEEVIVALNDWYHQESTDLAAWYLSPQSQGNEPIPDSGLINGNGRFDCTKAPPGSQCRADAPRENFNFVPGKRYRLRIINMSSFAAFKFSIDNHRLTVIEADMTPVNPVTVDRLNINVAQRYSVIVQANQHTNNYWMRAIMSTACFPTQSTSLDRNVLARVHYVGASDTDPTTQGMTMAANVDADCVDLDPTLLRPVEVQSVAQPTTLVQLDVSFAADASGVNRGMFNNISFVPDFSRSMLEDLSLNRVRTFAQTANVYQIPYNAEVRIVLNNADNGEHPFHLHGNDFQVLAWEKGVYDPQTTHLNMNNPIRRDTTTVPANGFTVLQFKADNLGLWTFHCHIEWHILAGLVMTFQVGTQQQIASRVRVPSGVQRMCAVGSRFERARAAQAQPSFPMQAQLHSGVNGMQQQTGGLLQQGNEDDDSTDQQATYLS